MLSQLSFDELDVSSNDAGSDGLRLFVQQLGPYGALGKWNVQKLSVDAGKDPEALFALVLAVLER